HMPLFLFIATAPTRTYPLSLHDALPIFDIRIALETFVVKSLANRIDEAYVEKLEENLDGQLETTINGDYERATVLDTDFHVKLRSEEHTSELQSRENLVCRLLLEKKKAK